MIIASREPTLLTLLLVAACRAAAPAAPAAPAISPSPARAAAPMEMSHTQTAESNPDTGQHAAAKFMQGMIAHHAQALVMTDLLKTRTGNETMRLLGQRIDISQQDEIAMMQRWLREHGAEVPEVPDHDAHHHMATGGGHMMLMPGMLTDEELARLATAKGPEFDRLFLEDMIRHHEGALTMVKDLFATQGATQDTQVFRFAADVDADQRAEIQRMQNFLQSMR